MVGMSSPGGQGSKRLGGEQRQQRLEKAEGPGSLGRGAGCGVRNGDGGQGPGRAPKPSGFARELGEGGWAPMGGC